MNYYQYPDTYTLMKQGVPEHQWRMTKLFLTKLFYSMLLTEANLDPTTFQTNKIYGFVLHQYFKILVDTKEIGYFSLSKYAPRLIRNRRSINLALPSNKRTIKNVPSFCFLSINIPRARKNIENNFMISAQFRNIFYPVKKGNAYRVRP